MARCPHTIKLVVAAAAHVPLVQLQVHWCGWHVDMPWWTNKTVYQTVWISGIRELGLRFLKERDAM